MRIKNRAGGAFLEYIVITGIIAAVFVTMNTYIKRGIQHNVKELSDQFIGEEHLTEINPTNSESQTLDDSTSLTEGLKGGGTKLTLFDVKNINSSATVEDKESPYTPAYVPASEGEVPCVLPRPDACFDPRHDPNDPACRPQPVDCAELYTQTGGGGGAQ